MIETIIQCLLYGLAFTMGVSYGTYCATKEFIKRHRLTKELLEPGHRIMNDQAVMIDRLHEQMNKMKEVRPTFKTIKEEGQNETSTDT